MKKTKMFMIISIIILIVAIVSSVSTYAWYVWSSTDEGLVTQIDTSVGSAKVFFAAGADITGRNIKPVSDKSLGIVKDIIVETNDANSISFNLYLDINELADELKDETFKYALYDDAGNEIAGGNFADYTTSPCNTNNTNHIVLISNEIIDNTTSTYTLYIWIDGTVANDPSMAGKSFNFTLHADGQNALIYDKTLVTASVDGLYEGYSCDSSTTDCTLSFLGSDINREQITSITFMDNNVVPTDALGSTDVSNAKDNSIMLWYTKDTENSTDTVNYYDVYIGAESGTVYISDGSYLFYGLTNAESINFGDVVDTTPMTTMLRMFYDCAKLTSLDVSNFNTSNVTNMKCAFDGCTSLKILDVSDWNTGNVTDMSYMFEICFSLESLDLSKWDVSNVTNMNSMFRGISAYGGDMSLKSVGDLSNWDMSNVTDINSMFQLCSNLETLNISNWNTSNVTNMRNLFYNCSSLTELDLSGFDTSKVTDMQSMFRGCDSLTTLNINNFDTSEVTNMYQMFAFCEQLIELDISSFNTSKVTNMGDMFFNCSNIKTIYISNLWDTDTVTYSTYMFTGCTSLVGGSGTTYNASYIDKTYARVDGGTSSPGYFTYKSV